MLNYMDNPLHDFILSEKDFMMEWILFIQAIFFVWKQFIPLISDDNSEIDLCHSQNIKKLTHYALCRVD